MKAIDRKWFAYLHESKQDGWFYAVKTMLIKQDIDEKRILNEASINAKGWVI